ncbi:MAG: hypothetical protein V4463_03980 [Pseudomonadota bacterium]
MNKILLTLLCAASAAALAEPGTDASFMKAQEQFNRGDYGLACPALRAYAARDAGFLSSHRAYADLMGAALGTCDAYQRAVAANASREALAAIRAEAPDMNVD